MNFLESAHCSAEVHCVACRNDETWRTKLFNLKQVPEVNFTCPRGKPLNETPPPVDRKETMEILGPVIWARWHKKAAAGLFMEKEEWWMRGQLPCGECKKHLNEALEKFPLRTNDQVQWMIDLHNEVNKKLNKPLWPYDNSI